VPSDLLPVARTISQSENDACARFCENLLPAALDVEDGEGEDLSSLLQPTDWRSVEHSDAVASRTRNRQVQRQKKSNHLKVRDETKGHEQRAKAGKSTRECRGGQKKSRASGNVQSQNVVHQRVATAPDETVSFTTQIDDDSVHSGSEGASEALDDFMLSSALDDARELLGSLPGESQLPCKDKVHGAVSSPDRVADICAAWFTADEDMAAIECMNEILGES
jgi:hypothetical protein